MSQYEELISAGTKIAVQAEKDACNLARYATGGRFNTVFNSLADGSNDSSVKKRILFVYFSSKGFIQGS